MIKWREDKKGHSSVLEGCRKHLYKWGLYIGPLKISRKPGRWCMFEKCNGEELRFTTSLITIVAVSVRFRTRAATRLTTILRRDPFSTRSKHNKARLPVAVINIYRWGKELHNGQKTLLFTLWQRQVANAPRFTAVRHDNSSPTTFWRAREISLTVMPPVDHNALFSPFFALFSQSFLILSFELTIEPFHPSSIFYSLQFIS